jgi:hypothetical protein
MMHRNHRVLSVKAVESKDQRAEAPTPG